MSDNQTPPDALASLDPPSWAVRRKTLLGVLGLMALVMGMAVVAGFARTRRPAYPVLDVRLTTTIVSASPQYVERSAGESWSLAALGLVREEPLSDTSKADYLVRDRSGAWTSVAYVPSGTAGQWEHSVLPASQRPAALNEQDIEALFMGLRARAGGPGASLVGLGNRMTATFTTRDLTWPFRYRGLARVWVDDATGQPRQIRIQSVVGANTVTILTTIDSIRTISTAALPGDFFTPPDEHATIWDLLTRWLHK